jgi:hypothetical protein
VYWIDSEPEIQDWKFSNDTEAGKYKPSWP